VIELLKRIYPDMFTKPEIGDYVMLKNGQAFGIVIWKILIELDNPPGHCVTTYPEAWVVVKKKIQVIKNDRFKQRRDQLPA